MNDLSDSPDPQSVASSANPSVVPSVPVTPTGAKEVEPGDIAPQEGLRDVTGQEAEIPKEVFSAGVRIRPTTVQVPPRVSKMGVRPAGHNIPVQTTTTVTLPMTDDQIAQGLHESITSSLRWLSEWCLRRMKQLHIIVKMVHGKLIRVKA
jgi:hypothetical protein